MAFCTSPQTICSFDMPGPPHLSLFAFMKVNSKQCLSMPQLLEHIKICKNCDGWPSMGTYEWELSLLHILQQLSASCIVKSVSKHDSPAARFRIENPVDTRRHGL